MKKTSLALVLLACSAAAFALDEHQVVFTEGSPVRRVAGVEEDISIGDVMLPGQTIVTGAADQVELEAGSYKVRVAENSVFTLMEVDEGGTTRPVLSNALGKLTFARQKLGGTEPRLAGSAAICGVRGTVVTLLSGADGTTLVVVDEGAVEVTAAGGKVALAKGEAVEVAAGAAPGQKYQALGREIDFSRWNQGKLDSLLADPVAAAAKVEKQLDAYIEQIRAIMPLYTEKRAVLEAERKKLRDLADKGDTAGAQAQNRQTVAPLQVETTNLFLNVRYYALSSLSLRRFVGGRAYSLLKAKFLTNPGDPVFRAYRERHRAIVDKFEREVVPYLVAADI